ncbi:MAG: hypothetical protein GX663_07640 [Clostridiales bacterium]|nr:hypothetical protein [Clostridiales bacterium]
MKKSIIIFVTMTVLSVGMVVYGCVFMDSQIGEATLTEETITGNRDMADGLTVGFKVDSTDDLHWINSFDYSANKTDSSFKRGEMIKKVDTLVYDDIRFTGWSTVPYCTQLKYDRLEGLQEKGIHAFYNEIQQRVMKSGLEEKGKIRLKNYLDFYPVSFRFQFGNKIYNSKNALTGLKVYDERSMLSSESGTSYDSDVDLYVAFNNLFKIPVIENEYQEYKVSKVEDYDYETSLGYETDVEKPLGAGEDFYEFDPIIAIQEENIRDGKRWFHPDLSGGLSYEIDGENEDGGESDESNVVRTASEYNLKNRMLFTVNHRTAKGAPVDISQIGDGYGVYELPIEVSATATIKKGRRSWTVPNPKPVIDELKMVYPLDEEAEYVEMGLSNDHRYLAIFSVKNGDYFVDLVDADNWTSQGPIEVFLASEKMTYAWGEDGSLAVTNHKGYVAVLSRTENENKPYEIIYSGKVENDLDKAFFDTEMAFKKNSLAKYKYGIDRGLAVATKDGKVAFVQNLLVGDSKFNIRNAALECAVIDKSGVIYRGRLKSNIVDLEYDMSEDESQTIRDLIDGTVNGAADSKVVNHLIKPVRNENWSEWEIPAGQ